MKYQTQVTASQGKEENQEMGNGIFNRANYMRITFYAYFLKLLLIIFLKYKKRRNSDFSTTPSRTLKKG